MLESLALLLVSLLLVLLLLVSLLLLSLLSLSFLAWLGLMLVVWWLALAAYLSRDNLYINRRWLSIRVTTSMFSGDRLPCKQLRAMVALPSQPQMDVSVMSIEVTLLTELTFAGITAKRFVVFYRMGFLADLLGV